MTAETTLRLAHATDKIIAIKEACGNVEQMQQIIDGRPENFLVLSGDDGLTVELIKRGGEGVISVAANAFTKSFCECIHNAMEGNIAIAEEQMTNLTHPIDLLFKEGNPSSVKVMTNLMELTSAEVRLPLVEGSDALAEEMKTAMAKYELR